MNILFKTRELGQQIWLDNLSRDLIQSAQLQAYIDQGVAGVTTNPAIFLKSIESDPLYQNEITKLKSQDISTKTRYETLAIEDVQAACDLFMPLYQQSHLQNGYVSIELDPALSDYCDGSIEEARRLWKTINRPNLMIKIPATNAGILAFEVLISEGINVNITLLFSLPQTEKIHHAYINGLSTRLLEQKSIHQIRAVASFFLSRIDTALDPSLPPFLQGKVAIAVAKVAYANWQTIFSSDLFKKLQLHQGQPLQLLWASTGTKNPAYSDVLYVDSLIGAQTVNTIPEKTLINFLDHGQAKSTLTANLDDAFETLNQVQQSAISLEVLANRLQQEGLAQFKDAFQKIINYLT